MTNVWTLQYFGGGMTPGTATPGQSQPCSAWGMINVKIDRQSHGTDILSFTIANAQMDNTELFGYLSTVALYRNGVQWFYGFVSKIPRQGNPSAESMQYEVSGPWFALRNVCFQQQWYTGNEINTGGGILAFELVPTNLSHIIFGNSNAGTKIDLAQVMLASLTYCLMCYSTAGQPTPFQIGELTPDLIIPYSEVTDRSCEEILQLCLKWLPDAATWFDYSTNPPTFNCGQRSGFASLTIPLGAAPLSAIPQLTPRYDLQVPVVAVKYEQTNSNNGQAMTQVYVDQYPLVDGNGNPISDTIPRALVQTINLEGSNATYISQSITTVVRPIDYTGANNAPTNAVSYMQLKHPALKPIPYTDLMPISLKTTIDPKSPDQTTMPNLVPFEIVKGNLADWMPNAIHQELIKTFAVKYVGNDPQFIPLFDSQGMMTFALPVSCTSISTGTYQTLASLTLPEPVPVGLAQGQYEALSILTYEGTLTLAENECGDWLIVQSLFNWFGNNICISGSAQSAWATMVARVEKVTENLDTGTTSISIGPPKILGLEDWHALLKCQRGRVPTLKFNQQTNAMAAQNAVPGADHPTKSAVVALTGGGSGASPWPFKVYDASSGTTAAINVNGMGNPTATDGITPGINGMDATGVNQIMTVGGTGVVYIALTFNSSQVLQTCVVMIGSSLPSDVIVNGFPTSAFKKIGTYNARLINGVASAGVTNTSNTGFVGYSYCGTGIGAVWY